MALLQQWHRQRPWLMAGVAAVGASLGAAMPWNWAASGAISTNENNFKNCQDKRIFSGRQNQCHARGLCVLLMFRMDPRISLTR